MSGERIFEGKNLLREDGQLSPFSLEFCNEVGVIIKGTQISSTLRYRYQDGRSIYEARKFARAKCFHSHCQMDGFLW